jgi:hypothetical protein
MTQKYGVEFMFCRPNEAAEKVIELLAMGNNTNDTVEREIEYGRTVFPG